MSKFKTIESDRAGTSAEEVVTQIREMIQSGNLNFGDHSVKIAGEYQSNPDEPSARFFLKCNLIS